MPSLALVAAASFVCANPTAIDGQTLACAGRSRPVILEGIGAPALSKLCRNGGDCKADAGAPPRDRLREIVEGRDTVCFSPKSQRARTGAARCYVEGNDLSCAMILLPGVRPAGAPLDCERPKTPIQKRDLKQNAKAFIALPPITRWLPLYLIMINIITFLAFVVDRGRARTATNRVSEAHLLALAIFGGGIGALYGQYRLEHLREQPFAARLAIIVGLQIGIGAAVAALYYWPSMR